MKTIDENNEQSKSMPHIPFLDDYFSMHDCRILSVTNENNNMIMDIDNEGGFTAANKLTFYNVTVIFQECNIGGTWWISDKLSIENGKYILHIELDDYFIGTNYFTFSFDDVSVEWDEDVDDISDSYNLDLDWMKKCQSILIDEEMIVISDLSFRNLPVEGVNISNATKEIGSLAFNSRLKYIYIPISINKIADDAFEGCDNLTIYCEPDSFAEEFAQKHNIKYVLE